ncbi:hypothetical protein BP5796_06544 [Coleophoma crateriformis]|uniref:Uncharacterized protein n=1 Tax=Coleophoma crateriformis TaxID=565419 RepID=A0A3D8RNV0_9HELO|nr:hypothetical protein BP5796_06544 [Coleophoma crateriformis]
MATQEAYPSEKSFPNPVEVDEEQVPRYSQVARMSSASSSSGLQKPIVVPQTTNIFMIRTFSPFARSYSPVLAQLPQPISQEEFLSFIDGLNEAFLSAPIFQAMHVVGGGLLGTQVLPAQAVGGVFQIISVAGSAGVSVIRVRSYMKKMHASLFAPRGLVVKIMTTKKMMAAIGYKDIDGKGKLSLPPLNNVVDMGAFGDVPKEQDDGQIQFGPEDPRIRRLRALEAFVSPLSFDVPEDTRKVGVVKRWSTAPLRWANNRQAKKVDKVREKSLKKREERAEEAQAETEKTQYELVELQQRIDSLRMEMQRNPTTKGEYELDRLENQQKMLLEDRQKAVEDIYAKGDKKLIKLYNKEEKVANRILWVVITKEDGSSGDDLVQVASQDTSV